MAWIPNAPRPPRESPHTPDPKNLCRGARLGMSERNTSSVFCSFFSITRRFVACFHNCRSGFSIRFCSSADFNCIGLRSPHPRSLLPLSPTRTNTFRPTTLINSFIIQQSQHGTRQHCRSSVRHLYARWRGRPKEMVEVHESLHSESASCISNALHLHPRV